jgi:hypothetical protein
MAERDLLPPELTEAVRAHGPADIVIGLPSYNNAGTIANVVTAVCQGLREHFPDKRALVLNTDGGSSDGTAQQFSGLIGQPGPTLLQAILPSQELHMPYHGIPGKGQGLRLTLIIARQVGARLCVMLSPDLTSVTPEWVPRLAKPILEQGFDFVVPFYARHKLDGTLNSGVIRPLVRSLYGKQVRQPMGGEYAFSAGLIDRYLGQGLWDTDLVRIGTDIWTTTQALCGSFKICQVHLGIKAQATSLAPVDLGTTLNQVLGSLFEDIGQNAHIWQKIRGSQATPMLGQPGIEVPAAINFDVRKLVESFRNGQRNLQDIWSLVLPPATLFELQRCANAAPERFTLPDELWCRLVFDFALGYRLRTINRNHLLGSFLPLYLGWLGSFVQEVHDSSDSEVDRRLHRLCQTYENQKPYLISRWRSPDRFNP